MLCPLKYLSTGTYRYWYVSSCIARDESLGAVSVGIEQRNPFSSAVSAFAGLLGYIGKHAKSSRRDFHLFLLNLVLIQVRSGLVLR
jgi:hypothetical protein